MKPTHQLIIAFSFFAIIGGASAETTTRREVGSGVDDECADIITSGYDGDKFVYTRTLEDAEKCEVAVKRKKQPRSAMRLGDHYSEYDPRRAVKVWESTPVKTCGTAASLGMAYYNGDGTIKNYKLAAKWYELASYNGCGVGYAQNNLGIMYDNGEGVPKDQIRAYALFLLATNNGSATAKTNAIRMERVLTTDQQILGQELARKLSAQNRQ